MYRLSRQQNKKRVSLYEIENDFLYVAMDDSHVYIDAAVIRRYTIINLKQDNRNEFDAQTCRWDNRDFLQ